jgi:metallophosphoesterase superfamily enzyme
VDEPFLDGPFALQHHPEEPSRGYALAGHIHPAVQLSGGGRQRLRLPCFWFGRRVGVLPAFGGFTGSALVTPKAGDRVFVVAENEVIQVM